MGEGGAMVGTFFKSTGKLQVADQNIDVVTMVG